MSTRDAHVEVIALGGTIAMNKEVAGGGVTPSLTSEDLVRAVPQLAHEARVVASTFRMVPGPHLTLDDIVALAEEIRRRIAGGADGVVVTQGTDTIDEVAFALDLLLDTEVPVVVTGAMRNPTLPGADGPANLLAAVQVAIHPSARGLGTLVLLNDEIHAASLVQKSHTSSPAAFRSPLAGPIGLVTEGVPRVLMRLAPERLTIPLEDDVAIPPVALLTQSLGDDGRLFPLVAEQGYRGMVLETLGGGHVPALVVEGLGRLAADIPVVMASRTGSGEVLRRTYGFPGAEIDLQSKGLVPAGYLNGPKARILLSLLLAEGADRDRVAAVFAQLYD